MKVGIIGSGGREHAIAWKLAQDLGPEDVFAIPGNGGTTNNLALDPADRSALVGGCRELGIELLVVGPEGPLAEGIVDDLAGSGIRVFGPGRQAARLESSKIWAKQFMMRHGVATPPFSVHRAPDPATSRIRDLGGRLVVKYDGLAAGKGVFVTADEQEASAAVAAVGELYGPGANFIVEERLHGSELSVLAFTDGCDVALLPTSQDHKPVGDGDRGPNTGGMGAFCPVPAVDEALLGAIRRQIIQPTLAGLQAEQLDYRGVLYFGVMVTATGPRLLEYNVRMGDPETEAVLPALSSRLIDLILACLDGTVGRARPTFHPGAFVDVVLASGGYPGAYRTGFPISGLDEAEQGCLVFHAGTQRRPNGSLATSGGRVLNVVGSGADLEEAIERAYRGVGRISFEGMLYRTDIGRRGWRLP
ncbi:MAG TPA: phosphoribosylamine--glycine ligase [Acidimicrobiia bacterium]|nr:phosphoribosylamine--glycine ligase [Acidimicrobiia bacterium]